MPAGAGGVAPGVGCAVAWLRGTQNEHGEDGSDEGLKRAVRTAHLSRQALGGTPCPGSLDPQAGYSRGSGPARSVNRLRPCVIPGMMTIRVPAALRPLAVRAAFGVLCLSAAPSPVCAQRATAAPAWACRAGCGRGPAPHRSHRWPATQRRRCPQPAERAVSGPPAGSARGAPARAGAADQRRLPGSLPAPGGLRRRASRDRPVAGVLPRRAPPLRGPRPRDVDVA